MGGGVSDDGVISNDAGHLICVGRTVAAPDPDEGTWTAATSEGSGRFQGTTPALLPGFHILYAYATDGQQATSTITGSKAAR